MHRLLTNPFLSKVGQFSFSIYLMHEPLLLVLAAWAQRLCQHPVKAFLLCLAPVLCVSLAAGIIFYRLVEAPSHQLAKRALLRKKEAEPATLPVFGDLIPSGV